MPVSPSLINSGLPPGRCGNDGQTQTHRFQHDVGKTFIGGIQDKYIASCHESQSIISICLSCEMDAVSQSQISCQFVQLVPFRAITADQQPHFSRSSDGSNNRLDALPGRQGGKQ